MSSPSTHAAHFFLDMSFEKNTTVLDLLGDGTIGDILKNQKGYSNIDLLVNSVETAALVQAKNCYRTIHNSPFVPDGRLPVKDRSYEVVIMGGVFKEGGLEMECFEQILRVVNSGKHILL